MESKDKAGKELIQEYIDSCKRLHEACQRLKDCPEFENPVESFRCRVIAGMEARIKEIQEKIKYGPQPAEHYQSNEFARIDELEREIRRVEKLK